jgi:hypothetical protein
VVLVLAGPADASVGDGEHVVFVHIVEPEKHCKPWGSCRRGLEH